MINVEFLIASDNDLNDIRIATITAKIEDKNLSSHENFRDAVIRAVTAWINGNKFFFLSSSSCSRYFHVLKLKSYSVLQ